MNMVSEIPQVRISYKGNSQPKQKITSSADAYNVLMQAYESDRIEHVEFSYVILMNVQHKVLGTVKISEGGVCGTLIDPFLIMQAAILSNSKRIILSHNHPSGNTQPSESDKRLTEKIKNGCKLLEIALLDHIIVTPEQGSYYSFADEGMM